ncbi:MAG: glutamate-cysteine ligase family protein [Gemmatimonadota bacterium]
MGQLDVRRTEDPEGIRAFTRRLLNDVRALELLLDSDLIESGVRRIGAEQEMFLVDQAWRAAPVALEVLEELDDPRFAPELGLFNLEFNTSPCLFQDRCLSRLESTLVELLGKARAAALRRGADIVLTGILPTLRKSDLVLENMTPMERYFALNEALNRMRGGSYNFFIKGTDELRVQHETMMLEACNTSFQVHFQVDPQSFARLYNIAMVATAPVLATAANSPLLFGQRLWRETRIALFQQSIDTRSSMPELRKIRPRVSFGSSWVDGSVLDIFRQDIAHFKVLLGSGASEDALEQVARGRAPRLEALQLFNSTVYRWNRPCYGVSDGIAHLRIENRVLPAGPTPADEVANAAFWYGFVNGLAAEHDDIRKVIEFDDAKTNFLAAARLGLGAPFHWFGGEEIGARELILGSLLDIARAGLRSAEVAAADIDRYLGIIRRRAEERRTGASWLLRSLSEMRGQGTLEERLCAVTAATAARQRETREVVDWEPALLEEAGGWKASFLRVEQYMRDDLVTVQQDEPLELVANLMDWHHVRHVPVEDGEHRLLGLVTRRTLLRFLATDEAREADRPVPVSQIMERDLVTVAPDTSTLDAIELMRARGISCLPVVRGDRLIGMITERDFLRVAGVLLEEQLRT